MPGLPRCKEIRNFTQKILMNDGEIILIYCWSEECIMADSCQCMTETTTIL